MHALCRLCMHAPSMQRSLCEWAMMAAQEAASGQKTWRTQVRIPLLLLNSLKDNFFDNITKQWCFASQMCFMYGSFVGRLKQPSFLKSLLRVETIKGHQSFVTTITLVEFMSSVWFNFLFNFCRPISWISRESNPGWLGGKGELFLCAGYLYFSQQ